MERHARWFPLVAVALIVVGLVTLASPPPAQAFDPQLALALASTAGAIALVVGYLIVANGRENKRAASLEGIYACTNREADGPMGCGGPGSPAPSAVAAAPESPMVSDGRVGSRTDTAAAVTQACPGGRAAGPMGCDGPMGAEPAYAEPAPSVASSSLAIVVQGQ
jgi:hypothetical protein